MTLTENNSDVLIFSDKVTKAGQVVRCICLLDHPIPDTKVEFFFHKGGGGPNHNSSVKKSQL